MTGGYIDKNSTCGSGWGENGMKELEAELVIVA